MSRPVTESTTMSFVIAHSRMVFILGKIQELSVSLALTTYEATMKLDEELREDFGQVPEDLRLHSRDQSMIDPPNLVMQRFTLDLTYNKSLCILHRKFMARARRDERFAYSRKTCITACMEMLEHQATLHSQCQPGGRLRSITWNVTTSLTAHDFLLAAMIVCLDLYHTAQAEAQGSNSPGDMYTWAVEHRDAMFAAIERAVVIWETLRDQSMEAYKANTVLKVMLEKLKHHQTLRQQLHNNFSFTSNADGVAADGHVAPEHSAAMTLGMLSSGGMRPENMGMYDRTFLQPPRTRLTPSPGGDQQGVAPVAPMAQMDTSTPFSVLFGSSFGGFQGMDLPGANLDWVSTSFLTICNHHS